MGTDTHTLRTATRQDTVIQTNTNLVVFFERLGLDRIEQRVLNHRVHDGLVPELDFVG